jgi:saccharopine dehydrogenase (NADP+, L-glutamate forming)
LDIASEAELEKSVTAHDVVISLIPYTYHAKVIKAAIKGGTQVLSTSYILDTMRELEDDAKKAGITVLNEFGVDPGVDHLYSIKKIDQVHAKGGKVLEFYSY